MNITKKFSNTRTFYLLDVTDFLNSTSTNISDMLFINDFQIFGSSKHGEHLMKILVSGFEQALNLFYPLDPSNQYEPSEPIRPLSPPQRSF
jgi:hypothetical protein